MSWWRRINCCYSWCQGISTHQIDSNLASYWEYMLVKYGVYICMYDVYLSIYMWILYCIYIYCCRVFLMSWINHYQALTGVHLFLIWPLWARFNTTLLENKLITATILLLQLRLLLQHLFYWISINVWQPTQSTWFSVITLLLQGDCMRDLSVYWTQKMGGG